MKHGPVLLVLALAVSGCAGERIYDRSESYSADLSRLAQQEVIDNIAETIDDPFRIPRRTTFGKGNLTFSDGTALSVAVPLHLFSKTPGTATGTAGAFTDSYQISLVPEVGGPTLLALRVVYQALVYPQADPKFARALEQALGAGPLSISWKKADGTPSDREPSAGDHFVGRSEKYEIWTTNPEAFARFVLLTYGDSPQEDRVKSVSTLLPAAAGPKIRPGRPAPGKVAPAGAPARGGRSASSSPVGTGLPPIPGENKPALLIAPLGRNVDRILQRRGGDLGAVLQQLETPKLTPGDNSPVVPTNPR